MYQEKPKKIPHNLREKYFQEKREICIKQHFKVLRMRLVWQYRIPMPLSVEEQRVGLRFMIMEGMYRWA